MKIYLDLLPPQKKEEIRKKRTIRKIIRQELRFLLPVVLFIAILAVANVSLKIQLAALGETRENFWSRGDFQELEKYEEKFKGTNKKVVLVLDLESRHLYWSQALRRLSVAVPDNVHIASLTTEDYEVSVAGKAKSREDLLAFQENLEADECFSEINMPLSSLASRENIVFQIDFSVNKECLKLTQ